jgi:uncharacterized metal-binding protein YceD (DUF177 family)
MISRKITKKIDGYLGHLNNTKKNLTFVHFIYPISNVDGLNAYTIAYADLPQGKYEFDFHVDSAFFKRFEGSEVLEGEVNVYVNVEKGSTFMMLKVSMEGEAKVQCDRCLDEYFEPIDFEGRLTVSFTGELEDEDGSTDEVMNMAPGDTEVNLAQYIYESICLSLPMQRFHPDDEEGNSTCNKAMLAKLRELQSQAQQAKDENSPWSKLSKIVNS